MQITYVDIRLAVPTVLVRLAIPILLLYRRLRYGYAFRKIPLTRGYYTIVDQCDYERMRQYKWQVNVHNGKPRQAGRTERKNNKQCYLTMHREIMNPPKHMVVDHINRNPLDNRRANLRLATPQQNTWNRYFYKDGISSKYYGVSLDKESNRWKVRIAVDGESKFIGYFDDEREAAKAFDAEALKHRGDFAYLNFPKKRRQQQRAQRS